MISRKLPYYEIEDGIYEIDEFDGTTVFVIVGDDKALVIDTGAGIGDLKWIIENKITDKPYEVVISHFHADHAGGAGFFDEVWIHDADKDWNASGIGPNHDFRVKYSGIIRGREGKHYNYDPERDIREWPHEPQQKSLEDGQIFDLGGRKVKALHVPGHTPGEMAFIDDKTKTLIACDVCNGNILLQLDEGPAGMEQLKTSIEAYERLLALQDVEYDPHKIYNSHHDFRGFGQSHHPTIMNDATEGLKAIYNGECEFVEMPDRLGGPGAVKVVARYGLVDFSVFGGRIDKVGPAK